MFGYTEKEWTLIKQLADRQFDNEDTKVSLVHQETDIDVHDPWMDQSARFELTDEQAIAEWGEEFLGKWCEKAAKYLNLK